VGLILICLATMGAALAVILDRNGPYSGWIANLRQRMVPRANGAPSEPHPVPETPMTPATPPPPAQPPTPAGELGRPVPAEPLPEPPPRSSLERHYDELYQRFLADLPKPRLGRTYELKTRRGERIRGKLEKLEPGLVTLRLKHGTMAYPVHILAREDVLRLFPEIAARSRALAAVQEGDATEKPAGRPLPAGTESLPPSAPSGSAPPSQPCYDPTPGPTPEELKPTLLAFGDWLKTQHRRVGGRIADRIFARLQADSAVLYLRMDPMFLAQDYGTRYQIAESVQTFWGLRCESNSVAKVSHAHVVLLDQSGQIIGGSRPYAAAEIWLSNK
jgi:hypothetical protein